MMVVQLHEYKQTKEYYSNLQINCKYSSEPKVIVDERTYVKQWMSLLTNNTTKSV